MSHIRIMIKNKTQEGQPKQPDSPISAPVESMGILIEGGFTKIFNIYNNALFGYTDESFTSLEERILNIKNHQQYEEKIKPEKQSQKQEAPKQEAPKQEVKGLEIVNEQS